jgi:hypothetical protein
MDGTWEGENYYGGLEGRTREYNKNPAASVRMRVQSEREQAENDILDGKLKIFYVGVKILSVEK